MPGSRGTTIATPDGRVLDVLVSGPADGVPLVFHHGTPGAVSPIRAVQRATKARGTPTGHVLAPGLRRFHPAPRGRVVDVADDVTTVLVGTL